jgi:class 3 adenylate cyclase
MAVSRRLVAVFAADVEGYSRLMGADEVGTLKGLTERRAILDRLIGRNQKKITFTGMLTWSGDDVSALAEGSPCPKDQRDTLVLLSDTQGRAARRVRPVWQRLSE